MLGHANIQVKESLIYSSVGERPSDYLQTMQTFTNVKHGGLVHVVVPWPFSILTTK